MKRSKEKFTFLPPIKVNPILISSSTGFTLIELLLYISIITLVVGFLVRFSWDIIEGRIKSAYQEEVFSQARFLSERIKYEIRNASGINSVTSTSISLSEFNSLTNPTVITFSSGSVTISQGSGAATALNSPTVTISNFSFTNNSSSDNKTKNISFNFTIKNSNSSVRSEYQVPSFTVEGTAEIRSN